MGRTVMLKEFVARVVLVLFVIGLATDAAPEDGSSAAAKQPSPDTKNASTSIPGEATN